jgi:thioredoxin-dependent peroxiredoxin
MLQIDQKFPMFKCQDQWGKWYDEQSIEKGLHLFYFYPKNHTPGCTKQACLMRDDYSRWEQAGIKVYGVSTDDMISHQTFMGEYQLPFILLSDVNHHLSKSCEIWGIQQFKDIRYEGVERCTFLVQNGFIIYSEKVHKIELHWDSVWNSIQEFL